MQAHEQAQFLRSVGLFVTDQIQRATEPLFQKIAELQSQIKDMQSRALVEEDDVSLMITAAVEALPVPKDGKDGENGKDAAEVNVDDIVSRVVSLVPPGKDGTAGTNGENGKDGEDGKSVELADVVPIIHETIENILAEWPKPKDGQNGKDGVSVDMDFVADAIDTKVARAVVDWLENHPPKNGKDGKDGRDGADVLNIVIDREGDLLVTLSNGHTKNLGRVVGKDGTAGRDGAPGKDGERGADGSNGLNGKDGHDGFGFDDIRMEYEQNEFWLVFQKGEETKRFLCPITAYQGVWKDGQYRVGHQVTLDGAQWIAIRSTDARPGTAESGWQLCVKKGRDGKDGKNGERGPQGPKGDPGRDLTQIGPDGSKWG